MSAITEYVRAALKGVKNADKVLEGVVNNLSLKIKTLPEDQRNEIIKRRLICATCPYMSENAKTSQEFKDLKGFHLHTDRLDNFCSLCHCNIEAKTASLSSSCGIESYNAENPHTPLPIKWTKYE